MVLQQLDRSADAGQRGLELVADRGGEVAQVARAAVDRLSHAAEILIERADLDRRRRRGFRDLAVTRGDLAGGQAQRLDRPRHPARDQARKADQQADDHRRPQQHLAPLFIDAAEQRPWRTRQQKGADHLAVDDDRTRIVQAKVRRPAQPFQGVVRPIGGVAAQHSVVASGQGLADLGQEGEIAAQAQAAHHLSPLVEHDDRGQGAAAGVGEDRRHTGGGGHGLGVGWRCGEARLRAFVQDLCGIEIDRRRDGRGGVGLWGWRRRLRCSARPERLGGRRQGRALRRQFRFGLAHQGVFIAPQPHRFDRRHGGGEQNHGQKNAAQPQRRPAPLEEVLDPGDHATRPWQAPRR